MFSVRWAAINPQRVVKLKERKKENNKIDKRICMGVCVCVWEYMVHFTRTNEIHRNPLLYVCRTYSHSKDHKLRPSPLQFSGGPCLHGRSHHLHTERYDSAPGTCMKKDLITATATEKPKSFLPIRIDTPGLNREKKRDGYIGRPWRMTTIEPISVMLRKLTNDNKKHYRGGCFLLWNCI